MRADCPICEAEGFSALTRLRIRFNNRSIVATLNVVHSKFLGDGEAFLSEIAFERLNASDGDIITVSHLPPITSLSDVRSKMYHSRLSEEAFSRIMSDIADGMYSNIEIAAFISVCAGDNLDLAEITGLTKAMVAVGNRLDWKQAIVADKHCVGGLPGNRTTPIVVAIAAAAGLTIPKTSSRAITSPAGTADVMETITNVILSEEQLYNVVNTEGGCLAWGGSVQLSPADDILISIERALDIDSMGQMIASVLSKKAAAGATHVVIDVPVGMTAKVRTITEANRLQDYFTAVGHSLGLQISVLITDGSQPVGRGIGPALEAIDVLSVLKNEVNAPRDLRDRAVHIAGTLLELTNKCETGEGFIAAEKILADGRALKKFESICRAQGSYKTPALGAYSREIVAINGGTVIGIDSRKLARLAKLAGAPQRASAGIKFLSPIGTNVQSGQVLFVLYAESPGELEYAMEYYRTNNHIIQIQ